MSGAYIRKRVTRKGVTRYLVCFHLHPSHPILYAGTFKTQREAKLRRDFVAGEIASGRDPRVKLRKLAAPLEPVRTLSVWWTLYADSRNDLDPKTIRDIRNASVAVIEAVGDIDPQRLSTVDVQDAITKLIARPLAPSTVRGYVTKLRRVLDYAKVKPNPARDENVKLPKQPRKRVVPPDASDYLAIVEHLSPQFRLPVVLMEQTAMRIGETVTLVWGDVHPASSRFLLRADATKTSRARWVQVPEWLMAVVETLCPLEDRVPGRRLFGVNEAGVRGGMARACRNARIAHFTPHGMRHRRASLWHGQGVTARDLADRGGWADPSEPLQTYSHVMPLDEASSEAILAALAGRP